MTADVFLSNLSWLGGGSASLHTSGRPELQLSQPLAFGGEPDKWTPEELLTGAVESCVLMTFLYFVKRHHVGLCRYTSHAAARVEKTPDGLRFTEMTLTLEVGVASPADVDKAADAVELAEKYCPVSHALNFPVHIQRTVTVAEDKALLVE